MQLALEALESVTGHFTRTPSTLRDSEVRGEAHKAITVLRQALVDADDTSQKRVDEKAKRKQEPVAWLKTWSDGSVTVLKTKSHAFADHELEPVYAAPPKHEWVGLTDDEIQDLGYLSQKIDEGNSPWFDRFGFAKAIEQVLKDKNA